MAVEQTLPPIQYSSSESILLFDFLDRGSFDSLETARLEAAKAVVTKSKWVLESANARIASDRRVIVGCDVYDLTISPFIDEEKRIRLGLSIFGTTINETDRELTSSDVETDEDTQKDNEEINRDREGVIFAICADRYLGAYQFSRRGGIETSSPSIPLPLKPEDLAKVELCFDIH